MYEKNEYESLKILRGELDVGVSDPRQFIEQEMLKVRKYELERIKARQGVLLQKEVEKKILKEDVNGSQGNIAGTSPKQEQAAKAVSLEQVQESKNFV